MKIIKLNNNDYIEYENYSEAQAFEQKYMYNWLESYSICNNAAEINHKEKEIAEVFKFYMGNGHKFINSVLRGNLVNSISFNNNYKINKYISLIDSEMINFSLPINLITYRRIDENRLMKNKYINDSLLNHIKKGFEWLDKGFVSTGIVFNEILDKPYITGDIILKIYINAGTKALYLDKLGYRRECELLIDRNLKFKIEKIEKILNPIIKDRIRKKYLKLCTVSINKGGLAPNYE